MKNYIIEKLSNESYEYLIIATNYNNPINELPSIKTEIKKKNARVLFDLTLINGTNYNRFIECSFVNSNFITQSCKIPEKVEDSIKQISIDFLAKHKELVEQSVLSNVLKYLIMNKAI